MLDSLLYGKEFIYGKHFDTLPEARNWIADSQYEDKHNMVIVSSDVTVDSWFDNWMDNLICGLASNTRRNYRERYVQNIQPVIGSMLISDVKPMRCKVVLNRMEEVYAGSTIRQTYITRSMLRAAVMDSVKYTKPVRDVSDIHKAYQILKDCYDERNSRKGAEILSNVLEYMDRRYFNAKLVRKWCGKEEEFSKKRVKSRFFRRI